MTPFDRRSLLAGGAGFGLLAALGRFRSARALTAEEELVEDCRISVQSLLSDPDFQWLDDYIVKAKGVAVFPELIKGGFILGGEGGTGVLLGRLADGSWSYPAFYYMGAASLGLQIGGQVSEVVLTIMNADALDRVLRNNIKLGADASMALGPIGRSAEAGTAGAFDNDIYTFGRAVGLFGGVSLEGAVLGEEQTRNQYYYGTKLSAADIVVKGEASNVHADQLRAALPR
jgi:lipid-binding SYLF domain-containing protein